MKIKLILIQKHPTAIDRLIPYLIKHSINYNISSNAISIICNNAEQQETIETLICHICNTCNYVRGVYPEIQLVIVAHAIHIVLQKF